MEMKGARVTCVHMHDHTPVRSIDCIYCRSLYNHLRRKRIYSTTVVHAVLVIKSAISAAKVNLYTKYRMHTSFTSFLVEL